MKAGDVVSSEPPFREEEPPPPDPEGATAQEDVWKASEVVGVPEISSEIIEQIVSGKGMLPSGRRAQLSVEEVEVSGVLDAEEAAGTSGDVRKEALESSDGAVQVSGGNGDVGAGGEAAENVDGEGVANRAVDVEGAGADVSAGSEDVGKESVEVNSEEPAAEVSVEESSVEEVDSAPLVVAGATEDVEEKGVEVSSEDANEVGGDVPVEELSEKVDGEAVADDAREVVAGAEAHEESSLVEAAPSSHEDVEEKTVEAVNSGDEVTEEASAEAPAEGSRDIVESGAVDAPDEETAAGVDAQVKQDVADTPDVQSVSAKEDLSAPPMSSSTKVLRVSIKHTSEEAVETQVSESETFSKEFETSGASQEIEVQVIIRDLPGVGSGMKDDSKKDSIRGSSEEGIAVDEKAEGNVQLAGSDGEWIEAGKEAESEESESEEKRESVHVREKCSDLDGNDKVIRSHSVKDFGRILQLSQWSLRHRIEVCKVMQNPSNWWVMSPVCRKAYAKQTLALIHRKELSVHYSDYDALFHKHWEKWTGLLEEELQRLREEDKKEHWYTISFGSQGSYQPEDIYLAVEKGEVKNVEKKMVEIGGKEHWASIWPQEYQGATPLHWAALHLKDFPHFKKLFLTEWEKLRYEMREHVQACDNFGFDILHMAIFATSWIPFHPESSDRTKRDKTAIHNCLLLIESLSTSATMKTVTGDEDQGTNKDFFIFKLGEEGESSRLLKPRYRIKNHFITAIPFLHLAIGIGHPHVISMLIMKFLRVNDSLRISSKANDIFDVRTNCGDSILHLAAWGMEPNFRDDYYARKRVMVILLQNLYYYPSLLNSSNKAGQSPLHIAAFLGSEDGVKALLCYPYLKADVQNKNGWTPLDMAEKLDAIGDVIKRGYIMHKEFGFSRDKNYDAMGHGNYVGVATLIQGFRPKLCQWKLIQSSQWSLRHRIFALQMLSENPSTFEIMRGPYVQQCLNLVNSSLLEGVGSSNQNIKGKDSLEGITKDLRLLMEERNIEHDFFLSIRHIPTVPPIYEGILREIFCAIEEDDGDEFRHLMMKIPEPWSQGLKVYKGATPLHWAALYGRRDMVSFIIREMQDFDKLQGTRETWLQNNNNARDEFGFTPLHLAVFSSPPRLGCTEDKKDEMEQDAKRTVEFIDELYEMGVPDIACSTSQSEFLVWNRRLDGIYVDDHFNINNMHPMFLGVHISHPHIVQKLLEKSIHQNFAKTIMSAGDSILHCARVWEGLIQDCSDDEWRKIETVLLMQLENIPKAVNSRNFARETPLHIAVRTKCIEWMEVLLQSEHVKFTLRDREILTPAGRAAKMLKDLNEDAAKVSKDSRKDAKEIQNIIDLIDSFDPESVPRREKEEKQKAREEKKERENKLEKERKKELEQKQKDREDKKAREKSDRDDRLQKEKDEEDNRRRIEALQRDRQVYVDAANAILVGGALVASASFGAWLQPPLGFHPYYSPEYLDATAPPSVGPVYESFVAIQQYWIIHLFWVFNSLSFFFSLATVMAGADAALPKPGLIGSGRESDVKAALKSVKNAVKRAAWLLILAIVFVICTFATLGFTVLPPITKYRINLIVTLGVGGLVCILFLIMLVVKLVSKEESTSKETPATTSSQDQPILSPDEPACPSSGASSQEPILSPDKPACPSSGA